MTRRRRNGIAIASVLVFVIAVTLVGLLTVGHSGTGVLPTTTTTTTIPSPWAPYVTEETHDLKAAARAVNVVLPATASAAAPSLLKPPFRDTIARHQVVGFVPYWELGHIAGEPLTSFTDLIYYALNISSTGALVETQSSGGWTSLLDGGAGALVGTGHAAGARVLLAVFANSESVLGPLCQHASTTGARLAAELAPILAQYRFDGVDLDIEGQAESERAGYVQFVQAFSGALAARDTSWSLVVDTYPQSAVDPTGFFDVQHLSRFVSQFFVMAYDMESTEIPTPDAPLGGESFSDASALATYAAAGLAGKVILGVPFYGYDFPAASNTIGTAATAQPYAVTYDAIAASIANEGHRPLWDPESDTPYTVFQEAGRWHQTWFDDPVSIALKTSLAAQFHVAGVGAWEIGMVEGQPDMLTALTGAEPVVKLPLAAQP